VKKKYKKRFFMNKKKHLLSLAFFNMFCALHTNIFASVTILDPLMESINTPEQTPEELTSKELTSKEPTSEEPTTQQEKVKPAKSKPVLNQLGDKLKAIPRCPHSNRPLKKLNLSQLEDVYDYIQTHKMDLAMIIETLNRLIALSDNHAGVKQYKLELADTHYKMHHIEIAATLYEDFNVMYPGSSETEYVLYKAVACMFEVSLAPDKDQTNTKKTIKLVKEFLKKAKNPDLVKEAHDIMQECYTKLYESEVYIYNFYMRKKNYKAVQMRLDYIARTFELTIPELDKKIADLTLQLATAQKPVVPESKQSRIRKLIG